MKWLRRFLLFQGVRHRFRPKEIFSAVYWLNARHHDGFDQQFVFFMTTGLNPVT
jgi:hypothetical protein